MQKDMIKIFSSTQLYEVKVVEALLQNNNIETFVMNKQDSSYPGLLHSGPIDVYISALFERVAKELISKEFTHLN
ncbi:MAG: DUF2007 domain-containing protein [Bacteroidota bacterium]